MDFLRTPPKEHHRKWTSKNIETGYPKKKKSPSCQQEVENVAAAVEGSNTEFLTLTFSSPGVYDISQGQGQLSRLRLLPFLSETESTLLFYTLFEELSWVQSSAALSRGSRRQLESRSIALETICSLEVGGSMRSDDSNKRECHPMLLELGGKLGKETGQVFGTAYCSLFPRQEEDGTGLPPVCDPVWETYHHHSTTSSQPSVSAQPPVAVVTLGGPRMMAFRRREDQSEILEGEPVDKGPVKVLIKGGSLLLVEGFTDQYWEHRVQSDDQLEGEPSIVITLVPPHTSSS